jgi:hypothetical protein
MKWFRSRGARWSFAAAALLFLAGCGGPGTVTGKVTFNGQPLPGGLVTVHDSEGQPRNGPISKDGTYSVSNITPGPAQVTVLTVPDLKSIRDPEGKGKDPLGKFVEIPQKFSDKTKSGFSLEVKSGKQEFNLDLKGEPAPPP